MNIHSHSGKTLLAASLAALLLISTGCGGGGGRTESTTAGGGETTTAAATTTTETVTLASAVDISNLVDEGTKDTTVTDPNITYLGYYDIRAAADIDPIVRLYDKTYANYEYDGVFTESEYQGSIKFIKCDWADRIVKLQELIQSDDAPDLVDREAESFPILAAKGVYEDLTDYIDLSKPHWAGFDKLVSQYEWNGKHIYYPWHVSALPLYVYYNGALFEEYGIDDPRKLYDEGEWDWNAFRDCIKKFLDAKGNSGEVHGAYGLQMVHAFTASTGTPVIGIENGKLANKLGNANIARAASFMETLRREGLTYAAEGYWGDNYKPIIKGEACFLVYGQDALSGLMKFDDQINVGFVPFPKDPDADKYYSGLDAFGYLVPKRAKNINAAAAFIDTARRSKVEEEFRSVIDESRKVNNLWTDEQIEFMKGFEDLSQHDFVADIYAGLDSDTAKIIDDALIATCFEGKDINGVNSWTSLSESYMNLVDTAVNNINNG